jgi:hypothetical protein
MAEQCVRDKALALAGEARRIGLSQQEESAAVAVASRLRTLQAELAKLQTTLRTAGEFNAHGGAILLTPIDDGLGRFRQRAAEGVPSNQALDAAIRAVQGVEGRVRKALRDAWRPWCLQRLSELRQDRLVALLPAEAAGARAALTDLKNLSRDEISVAAIKHFALSHRELRAQLDNAPDPDPALLDLRQRLETGTTLDKLSQDELRLLYDRQLASSVTVRWSTA